MQRFAEPEHGLQGVVGEQLFVAIPHVEHRWPAPYQETSSDRGDRSGSIDVGQPYVGSEIPEPAKVGGVEIETGKACGRLGVWRDRTPRRDQPDAALAVERRDADVSEGEERVGRGREDV